MKKIFFFGFLLVFMFAISSATQAAESPMDIYIFTQNGCPHCANILSQLETLKQNEYPQIVIHDFDMKADPKYVTKFNEFNYAYKISPQGIPVTFIGAKAIEGESENEISQAVEFYNLPVNEYPDPQLFVKTYLENNPLPENEQPQSGQENIGWIVIGVIIVGGVIFVVNKVF